MQSVFFDIDMGVDDALAIILALQPPEVEFLGVATIFGNMPPDQATRNTLDFFDATLKSRPNEVTIVTTTPLTNSVLVDKQQPGIFDRVRQVLVDVTHWLGLAAEIVEAQLSGCDDALAPFVRESYWVDGVMEIDIERFMQLFNHRMLGEI